MTLRGYEVLEGMAEHVHAYIIERTLIVWARQAKELSLIRATYIHQPVKIWPKCEFDFIQGHPTDGFGKLSVRKSFNPL